MLMLSVLSTPWQKPTHCHSATIRAVRRVTCGRTAQLLPPVPALPRPSRERAVPLCGFQPAPHPAGECGRAFRRSLASEAPTCGPQSPPPAVSPTDSLTGFHPHQKNHKPMGRPRATRKRPHCQVSLSRPCAGGPGLAPWAATERGSSSPPTPARVPPPALLPSAQTLAYVRHCS